MAGPGVCREGVDRRREVGLVVPVRRQLETEVGRGYAPDGSRPATLRGRRRPGPDLRTPRRICDNARPCTRSFRHVARLDQTPFPADILDLSHDGRGVARRDTGKALFLAGALPGERVMAKKTARSRSFAEAEIGSAHV